ncbi:MAG TPA: hypothetical protein EYP59_09325 [Thiotrichaceae bacterium]|nr:hypothetical protein [Thiotrichaceae bacterium]
MNENLFKKYRAIERNFSEDKGPFKLFALVQLEELPGLWDVVMSCENLPEKDMPTLRFVVDKVHAGLTKKEIVQISRIILLNLEQPFVKAMADFLEKAHNPAELFNCEIDGLKIKQAYIIVSPVIKYEDNVLISVSTLNDLINRVNQLERVVMRG